MMFKRLSKNVEVGVSLNTWALPLEIETCKPYTREDPETQDERWVTVIIIRLFCFYLVIQWPGIEGNLGKKKPKIGEPNWEKCTCPWQLGMGPDLNCPVHGRPELTTEESRREYRER